MNETENNEFSWDAVADHFDLSEGDLLSHIIEAITNTMAMEFNRKENTNSDAICIDVKGYTLILSKERPSRIFARN